MPTFQSAARKKCPSYPIPPSLPDIVEVPASSHHHKSISVASSENAAAAAARSVPGCTSCRLIARSTTFAGNYLLDIRLIRVIGADISNRRTRRKRSDARVTAIWFVSSPATTFPPPRARKCGIIQSPTCAKIPKNCIIVVFYQVVSRCLLDV